MKHCTQLAIVVEGFETLPPPLPAIPIRRMISFNDLGDIEKMSDEKLAEAIRMVWR